MPNQTNGLPWIKQRRPLSAALILTLGLALGTTACGGDDELAEDNRPVLEKLGIDTDLPSNPSDLNGNALSKRYNPLSGKIVSLAKTSELLTVGFNDENGRQFKVYDDMQSGPDSQHDGDGASEEWDGNVLKSISDASWTDTPKGTVGADVDADGRQELVIAYLSDGKLKLAIYDDKKKDFDQIHNGNIANFEKALAGTGTIDIAAGDVDYDGKDEIIVGVGNEDGEGFVYILDDKSNDYTQLKRINLDANHVRVAAGDPDSDGYSEIGIVYADTDFNKNGVARWAIYEDAEGNFKEKKNGIIQTEVEGELRTAVMGDIAFGDVDADRRQEVILIGIVNGESNTDSVYLQLDDGTKGYKLKAEMYADNADGYDHRAAFVDCGDIDGDSIDEIVFNRTIIDDFTENEWEVIGTIDVEYGRRYYSQTPQQLGDVNGDQKADIVYFDGDDHIRVYGSGTSGLVSLESMRVYSSGQHPVLAPINLDSGDKDNIVLRYTGQRNLIFTDPNITAVLVAAPCQDSFEQDVSNDCSTSFGESTLVENEVDQTVGVSFGFSFGFNFEVGVIVKIAEITVKNTIELGFDYISSYYSALETSVTYIGGGNEDAVVFTAIPQDVYTYEIVDHYQKKQIGGHYLIGIPREAQTLKVSRAFYNENNGDYPDIGPSIVSSTEGQVSSYMNVDERDALIEQVGGAWRSQEVTVGQGQGATAVAINRSEGQGQGFGTSLTNTFEMEVVKGGALFGFSSSVSFSYESKTTVTKTTSFEGEVADIPGNLWTAHRYNWGLFVYNTETDGDDFLVLDFWVE